MDATLNKETEVPLKGSPSCPACKYVPQLGQRVKTQMRCAKSHGVIVLHVSYYYEN